MYIYICNKELHTYTAYTVTLYPSIFQLTPKEKGNQRQALCITVHLYMYIYMPHLTPRQP